MAVTDPAPPSTLVGAKVFSARASDDPASNASIAITRLADTPETRLTSASPHRSKLPANTNGEHAFGEVRMSPLIRPHQVEPLVLVGQIGTVHKHLGILAELIGGRC